MSLNRSTGLRNKMLDTGSFKSIMALCFINIYSGTRPASANDAVPGGSVLLATITKDGDGTTGLSWDTAAAAGVLLKHQSHVWRDSSINANGIAGWFRIYEAGDTPANASSSAARADGTCGTSGADLNLSTVNLVAGTPLDISNASGFTLP